MYDGVKSQTEADGQAMLERRTCDGKRKRPPVVLRFIFVYGTLSLCKIDRNIPRNPPELHPCVTSQGNPVPTRWLDHASHFCALPRELVEESFAFRLES